MLWIEKYRPTGFSEILGQPRVVSHLHSFAKAGTFPHLLLTGPHGTGKSVSMECLASTLFGEFPGPNITVIQVSDLFSLGKKYLEEQEPYAHIYQKDKSLLVNFKNIARWYASIRPLDAEFRMMVFEGASSLTREAQSALRRIMERYSRTCRFVLISTHTSGIIPAISSRCLPFFFAPLDSDVITGHLCHVLEMEGFSIGDVSGDDLDLIVQASDGDMRKAMVLLQTMVESGTSFDLLRCSQTEAGQVAHAAFCAMVRGEMDSAVQRVEKLMIEYGLSSGEVVRHIRAAARIEYNDPRIVDALGDTDHILGHCNNEYVQLNTLVSRIVKEVFS
jgi:replication factor C small subunit